MFLDVNGLKIYYEYNGKIGADSPIVYIHGAGKSHHSWVNQLASEINGYAQIALDLPGHGDSEGMGFKSIDDYADFVKSFVDALGIDDFVIAGNSMGGAISQTFALKYQNYLKGMILIGTGAKLRVKKEILEGTLKGESYADNAYSSKTDKELIKKAESDFSKTPPQVRHDDFYACDNFDVMDQISNINVPTLIICGQDDMLTPVKYSEFLHSNIKNSQLKIIPEAGHMVMWEKPKEVNKAIANFVTNL